MSAFPSNKFHYGDANGIAKDELKALRDADRIMLRFTEDYGHQVIAFKEVSVEGFDNGTVERSISVGGYFEGTGEMYVKAASYSEGLAKYDEIFGSILEMLQAGDRIRLVWRAGNTNQIMENAGMDRYELRIIIERTSKAGRTKRLTFKVADQIVTKGYAYGMIRPY